jgi:flagellar hook protein FlgE
MIRSLRTGISGLKSSQIRMDVIGNNIANVNTAGFKRARVAFHELLGQELAGTGRAPGSGGTNASTIGYGVGVGSIEQDWSQGSFEYTNLGTDLALSGDGFFIVDAGKGTGNVLTRAGNFTFNSEGELVTPSGFPVQGWNANNNGEILMGALEDISLDVNETTPPKETTTVAIAGNLSSETDIGDPEGIVSLSTVVYDNQGRPHTAIIEMEKTGVDEWTVNKAEIAGDPDALPPVPATALNINAGAGATITFDAAGNMTGPATGSFTVDGTFPTSNGDTLAFDIDISDMTQYGGSTTTAVSDQNGYAPGRVVNYGIDSEGKLMLSFSNGEQRAVAQLALGNVNNPNGLNQMGDNFYGVTAGSGDLTIGRAGREVNSAVMAGALEMSNVDLATEFTDMIVTQRGYQASARVITTSDELLQEVVSLKR